MESSDSVVVGSVLCDFEKVKPVAVAVSAIPGSGSSGSGFKNVAALTSTYCLLRFPTQI